MVREHREINNLHMHLKGPHIGDALYECWSTKKPSRIRQTLLSQRVLENSIRVKLTPYKEIIARKS